MIPCQKCGRGNPLGTSFCRGCGTRLVFDPAAIAASVAGARRDTRDEQVLAWGSSALTLCGFVLICALIVRYALVPPLPPLDYPQAPAVALFPAEAPAWSGTALATAPATATADAPAGGPLTAWRQQHAARLLGDLGISTLKLDGWLARLVTAQQADGGFPGDDELAASALAVLALETCPTSPAVRQAAARGVRWLQAHALGLGSRSPLARSLLALALAEADALDPTLRGALETFLVDGSAPVWQGLLLGVEPPADRPAQQGPLRSALKSPIWTSYFILLDGGAPPPDLAVFGGEAAKALRTGEERLAWAATAWADPVAPLDLVAALRTWALSDPAPVEAELTRAAGADARVAVAILAVCAPLRLPPLWLVR